MRGGGAPKGAILNLPPGEHRAEDILLTWRALPAAAWRTDARRAALSALHTATVSVPGPFPINRAMRRISHALVPAMAASYGGLPVVGAGRSTGASRGGLRATPQAPHPPHFETPPEAPSLSGYNSYTGLLYNAQEVFVIHMG